MNVLFVDDEPKILHSLRNVLWDLDLPFACDFEFAIGGDEALRQLERGTIDVLVTDMRMPGIDGNELIEIVRHRWPHVVRLVLSGHTEAEIAWGVLPWVQDFLSKPCEPEHLVRALVTAHDSIEHRTAHDLVLLRELPARPGLLVRCQRIVAEGGDARDIGNEIETDVAASANLLHIANSAFFGFTTAATTPAEAVVRLGTDAVIGIVTRLCAEQLYEGIDGSLLELTNQRAVDVACEVRRRLAGDTSAFTSALLHDIGTLVLLARGDNRYEELHRRFLGAPRDLRTDERTLFGVSHDEVGGHLLELWQFEPSIIEVVSNHHEPDRLDGWQRLAAVAIQEVDDELREDAT